jgi:coproporphyrinogen III oxidase
LNPERVRERLASLQSEICRAFERQDGGRFLEDAWERGGDGAAGASAGSTLAGRGLTCVLENGVLFERAGVALSDIAGSQMPPVDRHASAQSQRPHQPSERALLQRRRYLVVRRWL